MWQEMYNCSYKLFRVHVQSQIITIFCIVHKIEWSHCQLRWQTCLTALPPIKCKGVILLSYPLHRQCSNTVADLQVSQKKKVELKVPRTSQYKIWRNLLRAAQRPYCCQWAEVDYHWPNAWTRAPPHQTAGSRETEGSKERQREGERTKLTAKLTGNSFLGYW